MAKRRSRQTLIQQSRSVPNEQKALHHQVLGAGRRRVLRKFLGLTAADITAIRERLDKGIQQNVERSAR